MSMLSNFKAKKFISPYDVRKEEKTILVLSVDLMAELQLIKAEAERHMDTSVYDHGTCVMGAGIKILLMEPRKKFPSRHKLISQPFQGNLASHKALKPCLEHLQQNYPELHAYWCDGNMD